VASKYYVLKQQLTMWKIIEKFLLTEYLWN